MKKSNTNQFLNRKRNKYEEEKIGLSDEEILSCEDDHNFEEISEDNQDEEEEFEEEKISSI